MLNEDDFFYTLTTNNKKYYYSKITGTRIAAKDIPIELLAKIKTKDNKETKIKESINLLDKRDNILGRISSLQSELKIINDSLRDREIYNKEDENYVRDYMKNQEINLQKRKEYVFANNTDPNVKFNSNTNGFTSPPNNNFTPPNSNFKPPPNNNFKPFSSNTYTPPNSNFKPPPNNFVPPQPNTSGEAGPCKSNYNFPLGILEKYNIKTKNEWKDWLKNNHFDKGGDHDTCAHVIAAGKSKGW